MLRVIVSHINQGRVCFFWSLPSKIEQFILQRASFFGGNSLFGKWAPGFHSLFAFGCILFQLLGSTSGFLRATDICSFPSRKLHRPFFFWNFGQEFPLGLSFWYNLWFFCNSWFNFRRCRDRSGHFGNLSNLFPLTF